MEETISLSEIFDVLKKRIWMIISFVVGAALIAAAVSYFMLTPEYEATSQFIVNQGQKETDQEYTVNDIRTNVELINTYNVIITSPAILDTVIDELDLPYGNGALKNNITVSSEQDSQVVNVTATDTDTAVATNIANTVVETFQQKIPDILDIDNVNILTTAKLAPNPAPVSPKPLLNIAIAVVLGGMVGVGLAFLLEYMDNTIRTEQDVEKLDIPVFGTISHVDPEDIPCGQPNMHEQRQIKRGEFIGTEKENI